LKLNLLLGRRTDDAEVELFEDIDEPNKSVIFPKVRVSERGAEFSAVLSIILLTNWR